MENFGNNILNTMPGFTFLIGIVECFFGYRIVKVILGVTGFIVCGLLCGEFVYKIIGNHPVIALIAGLVCGVVGIALMIGLFDFGVFILGAVLGFIVGQAISTCILGSANPSIVVALAIAGGIAALIMNKSMIIISTSFIGAYLIVFSIGKFIGMPKKIFSFQQFNVLREPGGQFFVMLSFCILVGLAGMIVQYKYTATSAGDRVTGRNSN
ncbi:MAG TPA: DUF4203 domain-containing protein [Nitrospirota bacterium]|nr:DUF4203 domain-containing protein [Nitrospirota bacterium]